MDEVVVAQDTKVESKATKLNAAIEKAATDAAATVDTEIKVEDKKVETKGEDKKEEDKKEDLTAEQLEFSKTLFKALNNPDVAIQKQTIQILAKAAGLDLKEIETKKEVVEAKESLIDLLKADLGEYDFLADKLGPVLEKVIKKFVDEGTKEIKESQRLDKEERFKVATNTAIDTAFASFTNSLEVKDEVVKLMDQIKPTAAMSAENYFKSLIVLAASNKNITLKSSSEKDKDKETKDKIKSNRDDAASRLASERSSEVKVGVKTSQRMGLNRAVEQAAEDAAKKFNL